MTCDGCGAAVLDIDVRCAQCGAVLGATGAHRMLGQMMLGQYELVDVLGQGGMSVVFKGKHKLTDQEVALKILPPELAANKEVKSRFLDEAKALAALDHSNIVHLYNFGQENGFFVLAMQYVQGHTWERMILEQTRLPWPESCRIAIDVLRALEYAHGRGVVHRDMKPSNVLVRASDGAATVMDFGIAKMTTSTRLTATGQTMGTVRYMSPEQVRGQEVDLRTDIYSLGATLYESLVGDTPFDGDTHFEIMTKHLSEIPKRPSVLGIEVPLPVEDALMRCLAKKPDDRFSNARELRKILEQVVRTSDVGLIETQRLDRDVVNQLPRTRSASAAPVTAPASPAPAARLQPTSTPTELADALEPGASAPQLRRRSVAPWIALALLLVGGGITAVVLLTTTPEHAKAALVPGVKLTAHEHFGKLDVYTDGRIAPKTVAETYQAASQALHARFSSTDSVTEIVVIPQEAFCAKTSYLDQAPPPDCATTPAVITISSTGGNRMYVVSDPARIVKAVTMGVVQAFCLLDRPSAEQCEQAEKALASPPVD